MLMHNNQHLRYVALCLLRKISLDQIRRGQQLARSLEKKLIGHCQSKESPSHRLISNMLDVVEIWQSQHFCIWQTILSQVTENQTHDLGTARGMH